MAILSNTDKNAILEKLLKFIFLSFLFSLAEKVTLSSNHFKTLILTVLIFIIEKNEITYGKNAAKYPNLLLFIII